MSPSRRRALVAIAIAALAGGGVGVALGLSEDSKPDPAPGVVATNEEGAYYSRGDLGGGRGSGPDAGDPKTVPRQEGDPEGLQPGPSGPRPSSPDEKAAARAARGYIEAIDRREGSAVCSSFAQGALAGLELPVSRDSCGDSIDASLGYRSGGGQPVWQSSQPTRAISAQVYGDSARVVATVFTKYADVREPTIEDDIVYLSRDGARWLVVKPSATLYRAIGVADVPLEALQPPR